MGLHLVRNGTSRLSQAAPTGPRQLTAAIKLCSSFNQLGDLFQASLPQFDHIHHTAFLVQCVRLLEREHLQLLPLGFLHVFSSAVAAFPDHISSCGPRELSTYVWALGKTRMHGFNPSSTLALVQQQLLTDSCKLLQACTTHDLANLAWGYAKLMHREPLFWEQLAPVAARMMPACRPQEVANIAWAYGKVRHRSKAVLAAAARQLKQRSKTFTVQHICNITWAHAAVRFRNRQLLRTIAVIAPLRRHYFTAQGVANMLWSHVRLGRLDEAIFRVFTKQAERHARQFTATGLSCVLWSISVSGYRDRNTPYVVRAIVHEFRSKSAYFQAADLAMFVRALARIKRPSKAVLHIVAMQAVAKIASFKAGTLACCVWGFVAAGCSDEGLFRIFAQRAGALLQMSAVGSQPTASYASHQPEAFSAQQLVLLALAFCGKPTCQALVPQIAAELAASLGTSYPQDRGGAVACLTWASSKSFLASAPTVSSLKILG